MSQAFAWCREAQRISVVILTGAGDKAFCSGGDMHVKGRGGYVGEDGVPRLNVLDVQKQIRSLPKPVIAMINMPFRSDGSSYAEVTSEARRL